MMAGLRWSLAPGLVTGGSRSKEDILEKSRGITVRADLERALGKPSDVNKLGPVEQWTYKASNGTVVFLIVADTVTLQAAVPDERRDWTVSDTRSEAVTDALTRRIDRLERENRRLKLYGTLTVVGLAALLVMGQTAPAPGGNAVGGGRFVVRRRAA